MKSLHTTPTPRATGLEPSSRLSCMEGSEMIPALLIEAFTKGVEMAFFFHAESGEEVLNDGLGMFFLYRYVMLYMYGYVMLYVYINLSLSLSLFIYI